jgi:hypothetical protein
MSENQHRDEWVAIIAKTVLGFETLETRNRDSLDFRECGVASIKAALEEAYDSGQRFGRIEALEHLQK